jgi:hypothetical protein
MQTRLRPVFRFKCIAGIPERWAARPVRLFGTGEGVVVAIGEELNPVMHPNAVWNTIWRPNFVLPPRLLKPVLQLLPQGPAIASLRAIRDDERLAIHTDVIVPAVAWYKAWDMRREHAIAVIRGAVARRRRIEQQDSDTEGKQSEW